jgi:hypothetical protein
VQSSFGHRRISLLRADDFNLLDCPVFRVHYNDAEREALEAVYAYESVLSGTHGKRTRASRTWQMIERHGIIAAVERVVTRRSVSVGYQALAKMGMEDMAFEAVVLRHPDVFSPQAVERSRERLREL